MNEKPRLLLFKEVAFRLRMADRTLYKKLANGVFPGAFKLGGQWRFREKDIEDFIEMKIEEGKNGARSL